MGLECHENHTILHNKSSFIPFVHKSFIDERLYEHCSVWRTGKFFYILSSDHQFSYHKRTHRSKNHFKIDSYSTNFTFVNETWSNAHAIETNDTTHMIPWLSYNRIRHNLEGSHFIFQGDSMVRQIFNRLIWHIRGYDVIVERAFHQDAFYTFNSSHDMLSIGNNSRETVENPIFFAEFYWDPILANVTVKHDMNRTDVVYIVGLLYWETRHSRTEVLEYFLSPSTLFVSVPTYDADKNGANMVINTRNKWISKHSLYLPLAEMAATKVYLRNAEDNMHFQCSLTDGPLVLNEDLSDLLFRAPRNKDCRDMVNLNLVMILVHFREHLYSAP